MITTSGSFVLGFGNGAADIRHVAATTLLCELLGGGLSVAPSHADGDPLSYDNIQRVQAELLGLCGFRPSRTFPNELAAFHYIEALTLPIVRALVQADARPVPPPEILYEWGPGMPDVTS